MAGRALVTVGGFDFPEPSTYKGNTSTLVDSARNVQGKMVGSVIRDDVGKVEVTWKYLTIEQWASVLQCFREASGGKFINNVTFFCEDLADWTTRQMYVSDRNAEMFRRDPKTGAVLGWTNCSLALVEV